MSTTPFTRNKRGNPASVSGSVGNSIKFAEPQKRRQTAITNSSPAASTNVKTTLVHMDSRMPR